MDSAVLFTSMIISTVIIKIIFHHSTWLAKEQQQNKIIYLSVCLSIFLYIYLSIYLSRRLFIVIPVFF